MRETFVLLVLLYLKGQIGCEKWEDVAEFRSRLSRNMVIYHNSHMQEAHALLEKGDASSDRNPRNVIWTINDLTRCSGYKFGLQVPQTDNVLQQFVRPELEQTLQARNDSDFGKRDDVSDNIAMDDKCPRYRLRLPQEPTDEILEKFARHIAKEDNTLDHSDFSILDDKCPNYRFRLQSPQAANLLKQMTKRHTVRGGKNSNEGSGKREDDTFSNSGDERVCGGYRFRSGEQQMANILDSIRSNTSPKNDIRSSETSDRHDSSKRMMPDKNACGGYRFRFTMAQTDNVLQQFVVSPEMLQTLEISNGTNYGNKLDIFGRQIAKRGEMPNVRAVSDEFDDKCPNYRFRPTQEQTGQLMEILTRQTIVDDGSTMPKDDKCPAYRFRLESSQATDMLQQLIKRKTPGKDQTSDEMFGKREDGIVNKQGDERQCGGYRFRSEERQIAQVLDTIKSKVSTASDIRSSRGLDEMFHESLDLPESIMQRAITMQPKDDKCPRYRIRLGKRELTEILKKIDLKKPNDDMHSTRPTTQGTSKLLNQLTRSQTNPNLEYNKREVNNVISNIIGDEKVCGGYRFRSGEQQMANILDSIRSNTSPKNEIRSSDKLGNKNLKPSSLAKYYLNWSSILQRTSVAMKQPHSYIEVDVSSMDFFWPFNYEMVKMNQRVAFYGLANQLDRKNLKARYYKSFYGMYNLPIPVSENRVVLNFNDPNIATILNKTLLMDASEDFLENTTYAYTNTEKDVVSQKIAEAMDMINRTSPDLYRSINQLISCIAVYKSKPGSDTIAGSMGTLPGVIYINAKTSDGDWPAAFYAELIVHEYIHNALFLEELILGTYTDRRILSQTKVVSAMLRIPRKYDHSLHAAYVVAGLVSFHGRAGYTERADSLLEPLRTSVNELVLANQKHGALTETGETMLQSLADFVEFIGK